MQSSVSPGPRSPAGLSPCGLPGPRRAGSSVLLGLAPGGVCLAAASPWRRCALTAPFHLCLCAPHVWPRHRRSVSVALSRGFPRVGVTDRPRPMVSGLSSRAFTSRDCMACASIVRRRAAPRSRCAALWRARSRSPRSPSARDPPAQTGHSARPRTRPSQAPRITSSSVISPARTAAAPAAPPRPSRRRPPLAVATRAHVRPSWNTPTTRPSSWASRVRIGL